MFGAFELTLLIPPQKKQLGPKNVPHLGLGMHAYRAVWDPKGFILGGRAIDPNFSPFLRGFFERFTFLTPKTTPKKYPEG